MSSNIAEIAVESAATSNPLDVIPGEMPFDVPYGPPISLAQAQAVIQAAVAEARKRNWKMNVAVADSGGNLVGLPTNGRRDARLHSDCGTQGASGRDFPAPNEGLRGWHPAYASQLSARVRWNHCVPRRYSTDRSEGKIIGAIGCSGGTDSQDEVVSEAGAAVINNLPAGNQMIQMIMEAEWPLDGRH
jgi:glc operon protein GlcG